MTVRLFLFGSPTVEYGGERLALPFERRNQLLVFLALKRSWVGRAELAATLWPEQETKLAYANLRKILHRLQSLPWARGIESQGAALRFEAETDVHAFESALHEQRLADALPMRIGELLVGFDDDQSEAWSSWLHFERDRLRAAWRDAALNRLSVDVDIGEGIELSARLLDSDPLDEAALRADMSWLERGGQSAQARRAYQDFVKRLQQDLGLTPGAELRALHDSLGTAMPQSHPAAAPEAAKLDADFIGRTIELRQIGSLLQQDDCRLLCLTGPGGVGKTRLAQRAMHEVAHGFSDGVTFVPLEDVESSDEMGRRIARQLDVRLAGRKEPLDQVIAFLRERQMLLVLDNFEQLASDASILERLLQACVRTKILVTTRVRLAIPMEHSLPIDGLPFPDPEDEDHFEAFDAVRLFVRAAQRVEPALVPAVEATSIVDICRLLGGLPLALELAAAWTRVLSCEAIANELRQGTELLQAVDAAHPARHASIDVVFAQSWRLLGAAERDALSRLSVFYGGFTAKAARAVTGAPLPVLGALADKSLLRKEGSRMLMHPMVQQLAAIRLGDLHVRESTERAHALYFQRMLAQSRRTVEDGDREALQAVEAEFENCRGAWLWSAAHGANDALANSALTLLYFCDHRGRFEDGLSLLRKVIDEPAVRADKVLETLLLSVTAHFEFRLDRCAESEATASRALAASRGRDNHDAKLLCLKVLGSCCVRLGKYADAKRFFRRALEVAPESTHPHNAAAMYSNLAVIERRLGRRDEALHLLRESLVLNRRIGDVPGVAGTLSTLGSLYADMGDYETAAAQYREGLAISERHGLVSKQGLIFAHLTDVALKANDLDLAESYGRRALEIVPATGNRALECWLKLRMVRLTLRRKDLAGARSELAASIATALVIGQPMLQLDGIICLAEILIAQGEPECARSVLTFAANHPSIDAPGRDEINAQLIRAPSAAAAPLAWPGIELSELAHRIVVESSLAFAPLIKTLRGTQQMSADLASVC